ncbi:MAG: hypothetical protein ACI9R3_002036 [Verrucomicrobiales bacterium]|jgi:hypothetical protein
MHRSLRAHRSRGDSALAKLRKIRMEPEHIDIVPVPLNEEPSKWEEWRGIAFFVLIVIGSSMAIWNIEMLRPVAPLILLGIGLFFDFVSLVARISTAITGRYSSGFFVVGFAFYFWAWLAYPHPILLRDSDGLFWLWIRKLPDIVSLAVLHLAIHISYGRDEDESDTSKQKNNKLPSA